MESRYSGNVSLRCKMNSARHLMDEEGNYDPFKDMAQITGFLGFTPKEFMLRSETTSQCFDVNGELVAITTAVYVPLHQALLSSFRSLEGRGACQNSHDLIRGSRDASGRQG